MGYYQRYQSNGELGDDYELRTDERGRYDGRSSAREYQSAGMVGGRDDYRDTSYGERSYGDRSYGARSYGERPSGDPSYGERGYGDRSFGDRGYGARGYGDRPYGYGAYGYGAYGPYGERPDNRAPGRQDSARYSAPRREPSDYDYNDRGFFARAGDEMASWFGDEEAERRRALDARHDDRLRGHDPEYHGWRQRQIEALDRDYHDFRREKQQHFNQQFEGWRSERDTQRQALASVTEHMEVIGSDGEHVGTVDKVRGDRIVLTKSDADAGGHHHSVPVRWIHAVADKVTLTKTADEAQQLWRDEEQGRAMFGSSSGSTDRPAGLDPAARDAGRTDL